MPETMMEALGRLTRENAALVAERDALAADKAALEAALAQRTALRDARVAQVQALQDDKAALIVDRDDWRDKAQAWKALADLPARTMDDNGTPDIWRALRQLVRMRQERDDAQAERGDLAARLSDAERERDEARTERDALAPELNRVALAERVRHLAALLDARCDQPRGH